MSNTKNIILYIDSDIDMLNRFIEHSKFDGINITGVIYSGCNIDIISICVNNNIRIFKDDKSIHVFATLSKSKAIVLLDYYIKPSKYVLDLSKNKYMILNCVPSNRILDVDQTDIYDCQIKRSGQYNYNYGGLIIYNYINNNVYYNMNVPIFNKDDASIIKQRIDGYQYKHYPSIVEQTVKGIRK